MDFGDSIRSLASRVLLHRDAVQTEEATKTALVMPFLQALGYNVFDPREVTPELVADIGTKKGEKVDYAILRDEKPIMIFECKKAGLDLSLNHASQLFRYFSTTDTRFGVLTNGLRYHFYADLDQPNRMDDKPFFEFDLLDWDDQALEELRKFTKEDFDLSRILSTANDLKYLKEIQKVLGIQLNTPSEDFVKVIASRVYAGKFTQSVRDQFAGLVRRAFNQLLSDRIQDRLKAAMVATSEDAVPHSDVDPRTPDDVVSTTEEEREAFFIVRAILREMVPARRVVMRDAKSYCAVLFDDNNRKPICRLYFNASKKKSIGFFATDRQEERVYIQELDDLYKHVDKLQASVLMYLAPQATHDPAAIG